MENLKLVFLLFFGLLLFQSCSEDEELNQPTFIGPWNTNNVDVDLQVNGTLLSLYLRFNANYDIQEALGFEEVYKASITSEFEGRIIEFNTDSTYIMTIPNKDNETGTWTLNSDKTILTIDAGTEHTSEFIINKMTSNSLVISTQEYRMIDFNKDGKDETLVVKTTLNLSK